MAGLVDAGNGIVQVAIGPQHLVGVYIFQEDEGCYRRSSSQKRWMSKQDGRGIDEDQVRRRATYSIVCRASRRTACGHDLTSVPQGPGGVAALPGVERPQMGPAVDAQMPSLSSRGALCWQSCPSSLRIE